MPAALEHARPMEAYILSLQRASGNAAVAQLIADAAAELPPEMTAPYIPGTVAKAYWESTPDQRAKINAATDNRLRELTGITRQLDFHKAEDRPASRMWLRLRDAEMVQQRGPVNAPQGGSRSEAEAEAPTFSNFRIQLVFQRYRSKASPSQLAALRFLDQPRSGPWTKLSWDDVAAGAARRIFRPELIDQKVLGLCGPAAALEGEAATQAEGYAKEVADVFQTGKAGGSAVNKKLLNTPPSGGLDPVDWMMLTAIQDVGNYILDYHGEQDTKWRDGLYDGQIKTALEHFSGCVKVTKYSCEWWGVMDQTVTINGLMGTYGNDVVVIMIVDSSVLQGQKPNKSDHAVRLLAPATIHDGKVDIQIFTWGSNRTYTFDETLFKKLVYGYIVGARKDSVAFP